MLILAPGLSTASTICVLYAESKLVDDPPETFSAQALQQLKANHEESIQARLGKSAHAEPVRIDCPSRGLTEAPYGIVRCETTATSRKRVQPQQAARLPQWLLP